MNHMLKQILFIGILVSLSVIGNAAGQWNIFSSHAAPDEILSYNNLLFIRTGSSFYSYDTESGVYRDYTKLEGLSDNAVAYLDVCPATQELVITYSNGNIDIMDASGNIHNLPDLKNKVLTGGKALLGHVMCGDRYFLCGEFGFVEIDIPRRCILNSVLFMPSCKWAFSYGDYYYMSNAEKTYRCSKSSNILDSSQWSIYRDRALKGVVNFEVNGTQKCWLITRLDAKDISTSYLYEINADNEFQQVCEYGYMIRMHDAGKYVALYGPGLVLMDKESGKYGLYNVSPFQLALSANAPDSTTLYMVYSDHRLMQCNVSDFAANNKMTVEEVAEIELPQGVGAQCLANMKVVDGTLIGIPYTFYDDFPSSSTASVSFWGRNQEWHTLTKVDVESQPACNGYFRAATDVVVDPNDKNRYYVSTFRDGLYYFEGDSLIAHYDHTNSIMQNCGSEKWVCDKISSMAFDKNGYLWMCNSETVPVLLSLSPEGQWQSYPIQNFDKVKNVPRIIQSQYDPYGLKWMISSYPDGKNCYCASYYDAGTPADKSDDESCSFKTLIDQDGNQIVPDVFCDICEDLSGAIWLMTSDGPFVIDSQLNTFNNPGTVRRIKIPRNDGTNLADYLLSDVYCSVVVVDIANRKWIGTRGNGVYLLSPDGLQTIHHFMQDNSLLPSNDICSIAIDPETGIVYISTSEGVVSYVSDAVEGSSDLKHVYCYPNPVYSEYQGMVTISGLMTHTQLRITDTVGHVVYSATSETGQVQWNLCNVDGNRVKTGVYLVFGVSEDGKEGMVSKLLVFN